MIPYASFDEFGYSIAARARLCVAYRAHFVIAFCVPVKSIINTHSDFVVIHAGQRVILHPVHPAASLNKPARPKFGNWTNLTENVAQVCTSRAANINKTTPSILGVFYAGDCQMSH
jgi:hypothetical protein